MIVMKKSLSRRTVLRGMGATLALPLLDGMVPALAAQRGTSVRPTPRFSITYVPNGINMPHWTPAREGRLEMTSILQPLTPFRDQVTIVSGLASSPAMPLGGEGTGDHVRASAAFLSGTHPKKTEGPDIRAGVSMDQLAAAVLGKDTPLTSLELVLPLLAALALAVAVSAIVTTLTLQTKLLPEPLSTLSSLYLESRFGLVFVDYPTLERVPKDSYYWYRDLIRSRRDAPRPSPVSAA